MDLNKSIQKLRESKDLTLKDMADRLYCSYQAYAHWEKGRRDWSLDTISRLTKELNFSLTILNGEIFITECEKKMETNIKSNEEKLILAITDKGIKYVVYKPCSFDLDSLNIIESYYNHVIAKMYVPSFYVIDEVTVLCYTDVFSTESECREHINRYAKEYIHYVGDGICYKPCAYEPSECQCVEVYALFEKSTGFLLTDLYAHPCVSPKLKYIIDNYYNLYAPIFENIDNKYGVVFVEEKSGVKVARILNQNIDYYSKYVDDLFPVEGNIETLKLTLSCGFSGLVLLDFNNEPIQLSKECYMHFSEAMAEAGFIEELQHIGAYVKYCLSKAYEPSEKIRDLALLYIDGIDFLKKDRYRFGLYNDKLLSERSI